MLGLNPSQIGTPSARQCAPTPRSCSILPAPVRSSSSRSSPPFAPERPSLVVCSSNSPEPSGSQDDKTEQLRQKFFNLQGYQQPEGSDDGSGASGSQTSSTNRPPSPNLTRLGSPNPGARGDVDASALDNVNPYALGRQARKAFDEVWSQLSNLASPTKSFIIDDTLEPGKDAEFESPQAAYTTVLVVGATGRVGRILTRKLLLRGYTVKALVRKGTQREEYSGSIPAAVEVVEGDVGDLDSCQQAVRGVNKVIFCAAARSLFTVELVRVDEQGVKNIVKALQDEKARVAWRDRQIEYSPEDTSPAAMRARRRLYSPVSKKEIADFSRRYHQSRWDITFVGTPEERQSMKAAAAAAAVAGTNGDAPQQPLGGSGLMKPAVDRWMAASKASALITEENHLIFEGTMFQRGAYAEVGAQLHSRLPGGEHRTAGTETITMRVRGDGNTYACVLETRQGHTYIARFPTRAGFLNVRLPYASFRPEREGQPFAFNPEDISGIAIRYEARRAPAAAAAAVSRNGRRPISSGASGEQDGKFEMEIDWIKATPGGVEPDVILVSSARNARSSVLSAADNERVVAAKRRGEEYLRFSGLGYTIIRPGQLVDEPGGYKTLVFDQSDRIDQPVSAADVADICLRALHEPSARNKTFDVCYEMASDMNSSLYELITSVPDKTGAYLTQATATLSKNT